MEKTQSMSSGNKKTCSQAFENIRTNAKLDQTYVIMNILATIIACYGLFANSPAVVIGAMVVAMLLGPLIGIALGVVESDNKFLLKAVISEVFGIFIVYVTALIIGFIHRDLQITNEILSRTAPNFIDLMIALAGGAAGAYALLSPRVGLSLVGVAVAIALVPPLSSSAILLARGEFIMAGNAALLAITNMIAIEFIASIMLLIFKCSKVSFNPGSFVKGLPRYSVSIIVLLGLGIILTGNLRQVATDQLYKTQTQAIIQRQLLDFPGAFLEDVRYDTTTPGTEIVRAVVRGPSEFTPVQVAAIADKLVLPPSGLKLDFRIRFIATTVITPDGYLYNDSSGLIK